MEFISLLPKVLLTFKNNLVSTTCIYNYIYFCIILYVLQKSVSFKITCIDVGKLVKNILNCRKFIVNVFELHAVVHPLLESGLRMLCQYMHLREWILPSVKYWRADIPRII